MTLVSRSILYLGWLVAILFTAASTAAIESGDSFERVSQLVSEYCLDCHAGADAEAGLNLDAFEPADWVSQLDRHSDQWEAVAKRLRARQMPPADADRPDESQYQAAIAQLDAALDRRAEAHPRAGRTDAVRRLNRTEYQNAVRDLLGVEVDVTDLLPADQSGHGFDNVTVGELPPMLVSRYITAAEKISRQAIGLRPKNPQGFTLRLPADRSQDGHVDGLPLGTRGGTSFTHDFPASGEYEIQLRLMRDRDEKVEGLNGPHEIDLLLDRRRVHRFEVDAPKQKDGWAKDYTLADAHLKKRFRVGVGPHAVGVTFPNKSSSLSEILRQPFDTSFNRHRHPRKAPAIYEVSIVGPLDTEQSSTPVDTPGRRRVFGEFLSVDWSVATEEASREAATEIIGRLARLAYRRPVTVNDLSVPLRFFELRNAADGFEAGIEAAVAAILVNPHFLFRAEKSAPEGTLPDSSKRVHRLSDIELASRLSFFLWSSIPDDELLQVAEQGQLADPQVLEQQVRRMLEDRRSYSLVSNFASQWLYLRNLDSFRPDMRLFPDFDDNLRQAMRRETELLFEEVLQNDGSLLDLIQSKHTYLNERLAKHYGIPHVVGSHFRKVDVRDPAVHRGGILRHASILAVTSYATRTSPTIRGNWILENILGTPPPPPPPNVPTLKEKKAAEATTMRERLAEHRANPACASCHNLMDPIGFALENYDAVGRWRVFENEQAIDSSGALPDGREISSVTALEAGIIERPELFVGATTEKLLTFALGRGVESYDAPAIRQIVREAAADDYKISSIVLGIARSLPFQNRDAVYEVSIDQEGH